LTLKETDDLDRKKHDPGADPGILERGAVRERSPEPSAEGASAGGGSGGHPQKILKKLDEISCNLAYIFGIRMVSDIIQNWVFAEQKTVAATISIHMTHMHTPPHFQKLLEFRRL